MNAPDNQRELDHLVRECGAAWPTPETCSRRSTVNSSRAAPTVLAQV